MTANTQAAPGTYHDGSLAGTWAVSVRRVERLRGGEPPSPCARAGANVLGVHLDRRVPHCRTPSASMSEIEGMGRQARFFNINAADPDERAKKPSIRGRGRNRAGGRARSCCTRSRSAR